MIEAETFQRKNDKGESEKFRDDLPIIDWHFH